MAKLTNAVKETLKSYFETGDVPIEADFADLIDAMQNGIQEHEHTASGGAGSGTGDAGPTPSFYIFAINGKEQLDHNVASSIWRGVIAAFGTLKVYRAQVYSYTLTGAARIYVWDATTEEVIYSLPAGAGEHNALATGSPLFSVDATHVLNINLHNNGEAGADTFYGYLFGLIE